MQRPSPAGKEPSLNLFVTVWRPAFVGFVIGVTVYFALVGPALSGGGPRHGSTPVPTTSGATSVPGSATVATAEVGFPRTSGQAEACALGDFACRFRANREFFDRVAADGWAAATSTLAPCETVTKRCPAGCGRHPAAPCVWHPPGAPRGGCACPSGKCMLVDGGRCVASPLLLRRPPGPKPGWCVGDATAPANMRRVSAPVALGTFGPTTGEHDTTDGQYVLRNVCIRFSDGRLLGNLKSPRSVLRLFEGRTELPPQFQRRAVTEVAGHLNAIAQISAADAAAATWAAGPSGLLHVLQSGGNEKHQMHRFTPLMGAMRARYGERYRRNATLVIASFFEPPGESAFPFAAITAAQRLHVGVTASPVLNDTRVLCFRELLVFQPCRGQCPSWTGPNGTLPNSPKNPPSVAGSCGSQLPRVFGSQNFLTWQGFPNRDDPARMAALRKSALRCAGNSRPRRINVRNPRVLIVWRSRNRRILGFGALAANVTRYAVESLNASSVQLVEHGQLATNDVVRLFADADVIIGRFGAGLAWAFLAPPGAVVAEMTRFGCGNNIAGLNCEYAVSAHQAGHHYFVVGGEKPGRGCFQTLANDEGHASVYVPLPIWRATLDTARCLLRREAAHSECVKFLDAAADANCPNPRLAAAAL